MEPNFIERAGRSEAPPVEGSAMMSVAELTREILARLDAGLMFPTRPIDDARRSLLHLLLRRDDDIGTVVQGPEGPLLMSVGLARQLGYEETTPRQCPARPCSGGQRAGWCGEPSVYVTTLPDGLQWFACHKHTDGAKTTPVAEWFERNGMPFPTKEHVNRDRRDVADPISWGDEP